MPTFTAFALDRFLEPETSKSVDKSLPNSNPPPKPKLPTKMTPVPKSKLDRRNSTSGMEKKVTRPQISPALYATPEATPVPDSPSSFPPSPYIINHKRRGPRLLKSMSEDDVASERKKLDGEKINGCVMVAEDKDVDATKGHRGTFSVSDSVEVKQSNDNHVGKQEFPNASHMGSSVNGLTNGLNDTEISSSGQFSTIASNGLGKENDVSKIVALSLERDDETENFVNPRESMSTDGKENSAVEKPFPATTTPMVEFYDACEELSSEGGLQPSFCDTEAELREMRLNLLMEIEKRQQAEDSLNNAQIQWQRMREQLAPVGLTFPAFPMAVPLDELSLDVDPAGQLFQQVYLARFVSDAIGRGIAKAETEMEKESQIEAKNFEISRLCDRLHYYEAVNQEMSQRNQEAVEMARRNRQIRKTRQRWIWGSIAAMITLGTAGLAWAYFPATGGPLSSRSSMAPELDGDGTT